MLKATCPRCGAELNLYVDTADGPPSEVGTECDCGAIPVWKVNAWWEFELGEYDHDERNLPVLQTGDDCPECGGLLTTMLDDDGNEIGACCSDCDYLHTWAVAA